MRRSLLCGAAVAASVLSVSPSSARAHEPGDTFGTCVTRFFINTPQELGHEEMEPPLFVRHARAGHPLCVAPWARPSDNPRYWGYYVGGGSAWGGGVPRYSQCEGTWGWDYAPWYSRVRLNWWHGRYQGGEGLYDPNEHNNPFNTPLGFPPKDGH